MIAHRPLTGAFFVLCALLAVVFGARLQIDFSPSAFFSETDPVVVRFRAYQERWGRDDTQMAVVIESETSLLDDEMLKTVDALVDALLALEATESATAITRVPLALTDEAGALLFTPAKDARARLGDQAWRTAVRTTPGVVPALLADDEKAAAILVVLDAETDEMAALRPLVKAVADVVERASEESGLVMRVAGIPAVRADFIRITLRDQFRLFPLALLVMGVLLAVIFRRVHGVLVPATAAFFPVLLLAGLMGATGEPVGLVNQVFFTLVPALAVADAIHLLHRVHEEVSARGGAPDAQTRDASIIAALEHVGAACALTSLTTMAGLFSLALSDIGVLRRFGLYAGAGMAFSFVTVLLGLPLLLSLLPPSEKLAAPPDEGHLEAWLARFAAVVVKRPAVPAVLALVVVVAAAALAPVTRVDNLLTTLLPDDEPTAKADRVLDERLGGILPMALEVSGPQDALSDPAFLRALESLEARLVRDEEQVRSALSVADVSRSVHRALTGEDTLPKDARTWAQERFLVDDDALARLFRTEGPRAHTRVLFGARDTGGEDMRALYTRVSAAARDSLLPFAVDVHVTGTSVAVYKKLGELVVDLRKSLGLACAVILLALVFAFRRATLVFASLLPNFAPLLLAYAFLGLIDYPLDVGPAVIFTIALGIAVDDTIHVVVRYAQERKTRSVVDAATAALTRTGRAIVITSVILCAGFGLHTLSAFPGIFIIGLLGAVVVFLALVFDVGVLPALLVLVDSDDDMNPQTQENA